VGRVIVEVEAQIPSKTAGQTVLSR
jgi:hypothetical protein